MTTARVAIIRGDNLNKFEMQNYEPLADEFDITCYTTYNNNFENLNYINLKIKKLHTIHELFNFNKFIRNLLDVILYKYGYLQYMFGLENELKNVDIAHTAEIRTGYSYQVIKLKKKINSIKIINTIWENIPLVSWKFLSLKYVEFNNNIKSDIIKFTDKFIAVSNRAKEALILEGVPKNKIVVIPMGVDINRFKPREKPKKLINKFDISYDDLIILFVGRLVWEKGIYFLIYAIKKLIKTLNTNIKLIIIGDGPEKARLNKIINTLKLNNYVKITGPVSYNKIHNFYNLADIFVLPSIPIIGWQEQLGMALIEAMASGLPIIASRSGSIPEVVKDAGILVNSADFLGIYESLKQLLLNEDLRTELSIKARKLAENRYNSLVISNKIKELYINILE